MCGIAGILTDRHPEAEAVHRVERMIAAMQHRGPDGNNVVAIRNRPTNCLALGHARLSILDLNETAAQPMLDLSTASWLVYNGEIYNFRELRNELESYGYRFVSTGDTEVVLKAMVHWKCEALKKFRGMFALGFWDGRERHLILARDTLGIKPLLFARNAGGLVFASELKAIEASELVTTSVNPHATMSYLTYGCVVEPETIASKVLSLPPGAMLVVKSDGGMSAPATFSSVTDLVRKAAGSRRSPRHATEIREALKESIKNHLISDVPIGISLSGGIDSSLLALLATDGGEYDVRTLTVNFPDEQFSELEYASRVSGHIRSKTEVIDLDDGSVMGFALEALAATDQPTVDGVNTYIVAKAASMAGIRVLLSGLGGDEIFGGYTTFIRAPMLARHNMLLPQLARLARRMFARPESWPKWHKLGEFHNVDTVRDAYLLYRSIRWRGLPFALEQELPPDQFWVAPETIQELGNAHDTDDFLQVAFLETSFYMRNQLLRDGDVFSSANSIELRVPYLHLPLIHAAWSFRGDDHIDWFAQKKVLREILRLYDPGLSRRRKMGFTLPWQRWFRTVLKDYVHDVLSSADGYTDVGLSPAWGRSLLTAYEAGNPAVTWMHIWSLIVLLTWYRSRIARIRSVEAAGVTKN